MDFFFAERHTTGSNFMMMTNIPCIDSTSVSEIEKAGVMAKSQAAEKNKDKKKIGTKAPEAPKKIVVIKLSEAEKLRNAFLDS